MGSSPKHDGDMWRKKVGGAKSRPSPDAEREPSKDLYPPEDQRDVEERMAKRIQGQRGAQWGKD